MDRSTPTSTLCSRPIRAIGHQRRSRGSKPLPRTRLPRPTRNFRRRKKARSSRASLLTSPSYPRIFSACPQRTCRRRYRSLRWWAAKLSIRRRLQIATEASFSLVAALLLMPASVGGSGMPRCHILLFFLRVGVTKIGELGTDPIAIRSNAVIDGNICRQGKHHILDVITQWPPVESRATKCGNRSQFVRQGVRAESRNQLLSVFFRVRGRSCIGNHFLRIVCDVSGE